MAAVERRLAEGSRAGHLHTEATSRLSQAIGPRWQTLSPGASEAAGKAKRIAEALSPSFSPPQESSARDLVTVATFLNESSTELRRLAAETGRLRASFGLPARHPTIEDATSAAALGGLIGSPHRPPSAWLNPAILPSAKESLRVLAPLAQDARDRRAAMEKVFKEDVLQLDLPAMAARFASDHRGLGKLKSQYRKDKRAVAKCTVAGKVSRAVIGQLAEAERWQDAVRALREAEQRHQAALGQVYAGEGTDFGLVDQAAAVAEEAIALAGRELDPNGLAARLGLETATDHATLLAAKGLAADVRAWREAATHSLGSGIVAAVTRLSLEAAASWAGQAAMALAGLADHAQGLEKTAGREVKLAEAIPLLEARALVSEVEAEFAKRALEDEALFGKLVSGVNTDWHAVSTAYTWTQQLRGRVEAPAEEWVAESVLEATMTPQDLAAALERWDRALSAFTSEFEEARARGLRADADGSFEDARALLDAMRLSVGTVPTWDAFLQHKARLAELGLADAVRFCEELRASRDVLPDILERAVLERWADEFIKRDSRLRPVRPAERDDLVREYRQLDLASVTAAAGRVMRACNARRPQTIIGAAGIILKESQKKKRHRPIRTLLAETGPVVRLLKPCFMMSPLTVSQFLPPEMRFDTVIFDEASQVKPADAVNCVYRGSQIIVAGDEQQLPPTTFFERIEESEDDEYHEEQLEEYESILKVCKSAGGLKGLPLRWHYRSQHESLITFSNYSFYEGRLISFPSALEKAPDVGVEFIHVGGGVYRRGGPRDNPIEAAKVVERVQFHARNHPKLTLGVVAFSEAQAAAIESELERQRKSAPELDGYFAEDRLNGFFVKNIETVQGDERDIIIFSVGYGPDEQGKITMNFGPLNRAGGHRRLNVAITRARRRVEIVSSVTASDFHEVKSEGVRHLRRYLDYAERGPAALAIEASPTGGDAESPFEEEVLRVIRGWGYDAVPQVGTLGYRIDIGVRHPDRPTTFALGVECDGAAYHSSKVARDRDRLRHEVLTTRLGWRLHRIWGTGWYHDRRGQEARLRQAIEDAIAGRNQEARERIPRQPPLRETQPVLEPMHAQLAGPPRWTIPYRVAHPPPPAHQQEMHEPGAAPEIQRLIREIVRIEGPVHQEVVLRRVREAWQVERAGQRIRNAYETALDWLVRRRELRRDAQGFLWQASQAIDAVRTPAEETGARSIEEVPREELQLAVKMLVEDAHSVSWDDLTISVARLFGWQRRGVDIARALDDAVRRLIKDGAITRRGEYLESRHDRAAASDGQ
ncbi:MAG: DUF3320 domain-containing protein [Actinobacteria bacterium]|nr:DUF3320 domain-containing protein [Actinomycetota bacterium]